MAMFCFSCEFSGFFSGRARILAPSPSGTKQTVAPCALSLHKPQKIMQPQRFRDFIVRQQQIVPRLAANTGGVVARLLAPARGSGRFRLHLVAFQLVPLFRLNHQNGVVRFRDKIGDVLRLLRAKLVIDLKLPLDWAEPLVRVALQDDGKAPFGIAVEFL